MSFLLSFELCLWVRILELTRFKWQLLQRTSPLVPLLHIKEFDILHAEHCGLWSSDIMKSFASLFNAFCPTNPLWVVEHQDKNRDLQENQQILPFVRHLEMYTHTPRWSPLPSSTLKLQSDWLCNCRCSEWERGNAPSYGLYRFVRAQKVWFLSYIGLKKGTD